MPVATPTLLHVARRTVGVGAVVAAGIYLVRVIDGSQLRAATRGLLDDPLGLALALLAYAAAFGLRSVAWSAVQPGLGRARSWSALHVSLLGNHVLPLRLGEVLRVTSVLRRTSLPRREVVASALVLRLGDLLAVLALAAVAAPALLLDVAGPALWGVGAALLAALGAGLWWARRALDRLPPAWVWLAAVLAWALESAVVWEVARAAGVTLSPADAVAVTAVTIAAQTVAVTPGGFGTYEAAATAALVATGAAAGPALGVALLTHAVKTAYALLTGAAALAWPAPAEWGRMRLPRTLPARPRAVAADAYAPVVAMLPAHNEESTVGAVVGRLPATVGTHPVIALVVDDGSSDASAQRAAAAGATVVSQGRNLGLGAAVRRGLVEATALRPAAVVYLDADGEYPPEALPEVVGPVLAGQADYVVGTRFGTGSRRMKTHRMIGNRVLTTWVRWMTRRRDLTDGQSGMRAFSPSAAEAAEIVHDYNYAQVLTLDLLGKGFVYAEVPIDYAFREQGRSFVRLGRYLRTVVPAVHRELNLQK